MVLCSSSPRVKKTPTILVNGEQGTDEEHTEQDRNRNSHLGFLPKSKWGGFLSHLIILRRVEIGREQKKRGKTSVSKHREHI